jgi:hypothetical protein
MLKIGVSTVIDTMLVENGFILYRIVGTSMIMFHTIANSMVIAMTSVGKTVMNAEMIDVTSTGMIIMMAVIIIAARVKVIAKITKVSV